VRAFGIFEGGGAKGFAHIGALKAAELRHVKFVGIAGASAGSIVASLVAAGYRADELFIPNENPENRGILDKDFLEFLSSDGWTNLQTIRAEVEALVNNEQPKSRFKRLVTKSKTVQIMGKWKTAHSICLRNRTILATLWRERGFFTTEKFVTWLDDQLARKVKRNPTLNRVVFHDMPTPLVVISTDLTTQSIKIFSKEKTPKVSVADAVAASISIPFIFRPFNLDGLELVDGGLLSNFPAWVFDDERQALDDFVPTFGFKLNNAVLKDNGVREKTTIDFVSDVFSTALSGDGVLEIRAIENMNLIPVKVRANTLDFEIPFEKKESLYVFGKDSASDFFRDFIGPSDPGDISDVLIVTRSHVLEAIERRPAPLRLNVTMPVGHKKDKLRILYPYNMNKDADDKMEFGLDVGAAGRCWQTHSPVVVDLQAAKGVFDSEWKLNKYQQALIRPTLRCLLSMPIFDGRKFDKSKQAVENPLLGVLTIDSDEDLVREFAKVEVQQAAADGAKIIAYRLLP
jgi:NTE family protein